MRVVGERVINVPQPRGNVVRYKYIHGVMAVSHQDHGHADEHRETR